MRCDLETIDIIENCIQTVSTYGYYWIHVNELHGNVIAPFVCTMYNWLLENRIDVILVDSYLVHRTHASFQKNLTATSFSHKNQSFLIANGQCFLFYLCKIVYSMSSVHVSVGLFRFFPPLYVPHWFMP